MALAALNSFEYQFPISPPFDTHSVNLTNVTYLYLYDHLSKAYTINKDKNLQCMKLATVEIF
ncbi:hypothetical protein V1478_005327 [Vespula squamosa]|uniref:Uncharacterized protein n=1 Tax=Vespula squamosa TaxID=30214 RepID=A0ABD2BDU0_VESSQ